MPRGKGMIGGSIAAWIWMQHDVTKCVIAKPFSLEGKSYEEEAFLPMDEYMNTNKYIPLPNILLCDAVD